MQTQSIIGTVAAKSGMLLPATITPQTDMNLLATCISVYHRINGCKVAYDTLEMVMEAMRDASAVVAMYTDAKGELAARALWPEAISITKDANIICRAYCTLRREWRSFRLDRVLACHPLTTPDDAEASDEQHQDWEDSLSAREPGLYR